MGTGEEEEREEGREEGYHCCNEGNPGPPPHVLALFSSAGELGEALTATTS